MLCFIVQWSTWVTEVHFRSEHGAWITDRAAYQHHQAKIRCPSHHSKDRSPGRILATYIRVRLNWYESGSIIASRWVHRESNVMFTLSSAKIKKITFVQRKRNVSCTCVEIKPELTNSTMAFSAVVIEVILKSKYCFVVIYQESLFTECHDAKGGIHSFPFPP